MGRKWKELRLLCMVCAAFGWWGFLYPEFTLMPDTCRVVVTEESAAAEDAGEPELSGGSRLIKREASSAGTQYSEALYREILEADPDRIVYKSWLWEEIRRWIEQKK